MRSKYIISLLLLTVGFACNKNPTDNSINIFSIEDDKQLGLQVSQQIASDPATYPLLDPAQFADAYAYVNNIRDKILNGGNVFYKDEFPWEMHIIQDDNTVNAFCTPGGYI